MRIPRLNAVSLRLSIDQELQGTVSYVVRERGMQTHRVSPAMTLKSEPAIARMEPPFSSYGLKRDMTGGGDGWREHW